MVEKRTLEDVLADLKEAEKEYKEKCLKYGIEEKHKRRKTEEVSENEETLKEENNKELPVQEVNETSEN